MAKKRGHNSMGKIAQTVRRICAVICFAEVVVLFAAAGSSAALHFKWIERLQITPIALTVSLTLIALWLLFTFAFGRIYCSIICPMGTFQDIMAWISSRLDKKLRRSYRYTNPRNQLRYRWLALMIILAAAGLTFITSLFDPYDAFGGFINNLFKPLVDNEMGDEVVIGSVVGIIASAATFIVVAAVSAHKGRTICNTFCPVGALLSIPARFSYYAIDINTDLCTGCGLCSRSCKCHCIDMQSHTVDTSRCVVCFDCIAECEPGAINYTRNRHRLSTPLMMKVSSPQTAAQFSDKLSQTDLTTKTPTEK